VLLVLAGASATAATPGDHGGRTTVLRHRDSVLASRSHQVLLQLYALDSHLDAVRGRLATLTSTAERVRADRAAARRDLRVTRRNLRISLRTLAANLRTLYEQGDTNALAVVLGATSVDEAMSKIDAITSVATQSRAIVTETRGAQERLRSTGARLARRAAELESLERDAAREAAALEQARAERADYLTELSTERRLNQATIGRLEAAARRADVRAQTQNIVASAVGSSASATVPPPTRAPADDGSAAPSAPGASTLTVTATGYSMEGETSTGMPVGYGVAAVDPSVIPLGTRLSIPGYGDAVAADIGPGIQGPSIDLWFPTTAEALAWGRRTVTITLP
jgi:cystine transport system substrate-binding protein